jgi:RNA polymerase sigma-70 factor (ECF subfamily)
MKIRSLKFKNLRFDSGSFVCTDSSGKNSFPFGATKPELATLWMQWEPNMPDKPHQEFLQFYKPIHSRFVKFCSSMAYGRMETQDLVQETVLVVMQKWDRIEKKESLLAFMVGTAGRILQNQGRKSSRETGLDAERDSLRKLEAQTQDPSLAFDIHLMFEAMKQLGEKERECLVLFEISGFSVKEVAEIQQETETAIKSRLSRGRQKLKAILEDEPTVKTNSATRSPAALFSILSIL